MSKNVEKYYYATPLEHTILNRYMRRIFHQLENFILQINANI